jgi:hypothetical protein
MNPGRCKGISTCQNKNGFFVIQLHYTADPAKDPATEKGKEWIKAAKEGMPAASWRKEYELEWHALSGELVYPYFDRSVHLVQPFAIPADWTRYMAIDPGLRNPTAALWAAVDPEGTVYFYREHYVSEKTIDWHAGKFLEHEAAAGFTKQQDSWGQLKAVVPNEKISVRLIDPAAASRSLINKVSILDEYRRHKIVCKPANNDILSGIDLVNQGLKKLRIRFFSSLTNTVNEITNYRWEDSGDTDIRDLIEKPRKIKDHLMDCLRYIILSNPHYIKLRKPDDTPTLEDALEYWTDDEPGQTTGY